MEGGRGVNSAGLSVCDLCSVTHAAAAVAAAAAAAVFGFHPGIVFWTTCGLTVLAAAVAASIPAHLVKKPDHDGGGSSSSDAQQAAHASCQAGDADSDQQEPLLHASDYADDLEAVADICRKAAAVAAAAAAAEGTKVQPAGEQGVAAAAAGVAPAPAEDAAQQSDVALPPDVANAGDARDQSGAAWMSSSSSSNDAARADQRR
jgi:hypothetical protein